MAKLCERPGCSNPGEAAYGMVAEELLFWLSPIDVTADRAGVLCRRHADAMVVPRGWTLDDRRNGGPRLFQAERFANHAPAGTAPDARAARPRRSARGGEQLQIDGTGEITRPAELPSELPDEIDDVVAEGVDAVADVVVADGADAAPTVGEFDAAPEMEPEQVSEAPWIPHFDIDDDLGGVLDVRSPLLSRAFRGTDLPR